MSHSFAPHGGNLFQEAKRLGCRQDELLDASASLVPFPLPKSLRRSLRKALFDNSLRVYPDTNHEGLCTSIGDWHRVDPSMVLPGNGAAELFTWAAKDSLLKGLSGLPAPGFSDYVRALRCWEASYQFYPLPLEWSSTFPQPFPILPATDVLWITNPHNPTGQLWSKSSIENLLNTYQLVICDEAFLPLVPDGESQSAISLVQDWPNLIVIRSLTKLFAVAGLRLGYAIANPERLRQWSDWRDPWPVNGLAIEAGTTVMSDASGMQKWINRVQNWVSLEGDWLQKKLKNVPGITTYPSSANFLLIKGDIPLIDLREKLAMRKILLRDCRSFSRLGEYWLRVGLQNRQGNRRIAKAIRESLR